MKNSQLCGLLAVMNTVPNLSPGALTFWATVSLIAMVVYIAKGQ